MADKGEESMSDCHGTGHEVRRSPLRRLMVATVGFTVLAIGLVMIALPGPAFLVIPIGLAILASEFCWARRLRDRGIAWLHRRYPK